MTDLPCFMVLLVVPESVYLAYIASGNESGNIPFTYHIHEVTELFLGEEGLDLDVDLAAVAAFDLIQTAAAIEGFNYILAYLLIIF